MYMQSDAWTELDRGMKGRAFEMAEQLLELGANPSAIRAVGDYEEAPLHIAAKCGCKPIVELLLEKRADINAKAGDGGTAFHYACRGGSIQCVTALVNGGCDTEAIDNDGKTGKYFAANSQVEERLRDLINLKQAKPAQIRKIERKMKIADEKETSRRNNQIDVKSAKLKKGKRLAAEARASKHKQEQARLEKAQQALFQTAAQARADRAARETPARAAHNPHAAILERKLSRAAAVRESDSTPVSWEQSPEQLRELRESAARREASREAERGQLVKLQLEEG
jgi:hypothetical protein